MIPASALYCKALCPNGTNFYDTLRSALTSACAHDVQSCLFQQAWVGAETSPASEENLFQNGECRWEPSCCKPEISAAGQEITESLVLIKTLSAPHR